MTVIIGSMDSNLTSAADKVFVWERQKYPVGQLSPKFVMWNLGQRKSSLIKMRALVQGKEPEHRGGGGFGAHLPVVITHNPKDSPFPANAANKGTGFIAKHDYIDYYLEQFRAVYQATAVEPDASPQQKVAATIKRIDTILGFYEDVEKIDLRCLAGLEIWPGQTSRNFKQDPRVSLHFLGMPTPKTGMHYQQWQVNCIWEKISPGDKRFDFGVALRSLTMGSVGQSFVPGHIPTEQTPIKGQYPNGWLLWVIESLDKSIEPLK